MLQVADHRVARARAEQSRARRLQPRSLVGRQEVRADEHQRSGRAERSRGRLAEVDVDAVGVHRAEVERDRAVGQVRRARRGAAVGIDVDGVGDERHGRGSRPCGVPVRASTRPPRGRVRAAAPRSPRPGRSSLGDRSAESQSSVMSYSVGQPERSASVAAPGSLIQSSGCRMPERAGGAHHGPRQALVGAPVESAGQPLHRSHRPQPTGRDIRNLVRTPRANDGRRPDRRSCVGSAGGSTKSTRNAASDRSRPATRCWLRRQTSSHASSDTTTRSVIVRPDRRPRSPRSVRAARTRAADACAPRATGRLGRARLRRASGGCGPPHPTSFGGNIARESRPASGSR